MYLYSLVSPILDEIAEVFSNSNRGNCNFRLHGFYNEKFSESPNEISLFLRKLMLTQYCQKFSLKNIDGDQAMSLLHFASVKCPVSANKISLKRWFYIFNNG